MAKVDTKHEEQIQLYHERLDDKYEWFVPNCYGLNDFSVNFACAVYEGISAELVKNEIRKLPDWLRKKISVDAIQHVHKRLIDGTDYTASSLPCFMTIAQWCVL